MQTLLVQVEGRVLRFENPRLIRIGRSIEADVVIGAGSVSRRHAELRVVNGQWVLADTGSAYGTFVNGQKVSELTITGPVTVRCGPEDSATFTVTPENQASPELQAPSAPPAAPPPHPHTSIAGSAPFAAPTPPTPGPPPPASPLSPPSPTGPPASSAPATPGPPAGGEGGFEQTRIIAAVPGLGQPGPGGPGPRSGPDLLVVAEGHEYRFRHPAQITVGRQPGSDIVIADPACSRQHGRIAAVPGAWIYTNASNEGTFDDGKRVTSQQFDERTVLRLGHPVAGPELTLVPILSSEEEERRFARKRRNRVLLTVGVVAAAIVLIAGTITTAVLLSGDDDSRNDAGGGGDDSATLATLTADELDSAKNATVLLVGTAPDNVNGGTVDYQGSGSILTPEGLILTNAHVAQPTADGLAQYYGDDGIGDPDYLLVALVDGVNDDGAVASYRARPVEVDGFRDVAVVKIYADADGDEIDPDDLDLPTMPLGDSDEMESGDDITILGFPGISSSSRLSVTKGVISTFIDRPDLGPRSEIDTDARIAGGNSGGAAINNDAQIIGIPSALFTPEGSPVPSGRVRPINFVKDLIEDAEESADSGSVEGD